MYVVIFRAKISQLDDEYHQTALRMRTLAENKYGCTEFVSLTENDDEIALSYWEDENQIKQWKQDAEHLVAQQSGKEKWYQYYRVEVCKIERSYASS